jgi:hypothetical protein
LNRFVLLFVFLGLGVLSYAQLKNAVFEEYTGRRVSPGLTWWHEAFIGTAVTTDVFFKLDGDYDTTSITFSALQKGNTALGVNSGLTLGYTIKLGVDDVPQSIGVGTIASYFPERFLKYGLTFQLKWLAVGQKELFLSGIGGGEFLAVHHLPTGTIESYTTIYLLDLKYKNLEFFWGLQEDLNWLGDTHVWDDTFNSYRLTYTIKF